MILGGLIDFTDDSIIVENKIVLEVSRKMCT